MAKASYPLAKMPAFTKEQLKWLNGHFYKDVTLGEHAEMSYTAGINHVILTIEKQMNTQSTLNEKHFNIGG